MKFILATTHPQKVPPTILSRCQRLDFRRILVMEIIGQLEKIVSAEKINVDKEVLFAIARSSDGSLRDAESILDQLVSFSQGRISSEDVNSMLGLVEQDTLFEMVEKIASKNARAALGLLNSIINGGKDAWVFLANFVEHFRNLMIAKVSQADPKLIDLPQEICQRLLQQAQLFSLEEIFNIFNILVNTQEMSKRLDSLRIPLEITLVKLAHDKKVTNINPPQAKYSQGIEQPLPVEKPAVSPDEKEDNAADTLAKDESTTLESIKNYWKKIISELGMVKMSLANYLNEGNPVSLKDNALTISFPKNYSLYKESLEKKENKIILEKILSGLCKVNLRVNFILSKEEKLRDDTEISPSVKSALDIFNGKVVREG